MHLDPESLAPAVESVAGQKTVEEVFAAEYFLYAFVEYSTAAGVAELMVGTAWIEAVVLAVETAVLAVEAVVLAVEAVALAEIVVVVLVETVVLAAVVVVVVVVVVVLTVMLLVVVVDSG